MKKIITSIALVLSCAFVSAQDSYTVKMNMKIEGLPPEMAGFGDQETVSYIKGEKSKTEISGMMGSQIILFDGKTHYFLNDAMGNKNGYTATKEEMEAANKSEKAEAKPKIEYTSDKKTIAGYECTKAIVTAEGKDKKEGKITVWVTDKIKSDMAQGKKGGNNGMMNLGDLKGYPLEMEMNQSQQGMEMKIIITATDVSTKTLDDSVFAVSTDGYNLTSYKAFMDKMKSMKAGQH